MLLFNYKITIGNRQIVNVYELYLFIFHFYIKIPLNFYTGDKAGYSGVALYSKKKPIAVRMGKDIKELNDNEGRVIEAEYEQFFLVSTCNIFNFNIIYFMMTIN